MRERHGNARGEPSEGGLAWPDQNRTMPLDARQSCCACHLLFTSVGSPLCASTAGSADV